MAILFDIQRFCIHDGPGVRTTLFFKGCPLRCQWCQNPESQNPKPEIAFYQEKCVGCFECLEACPREAILSLPDQRVDRNRCDACGKCAEVCTQDALRLVGGDWDAESLLEEIAADRDFFLDSGGGVTLSGGEPLLHGDFLLEFLSLAKSEGIHINLETCGMAGYEVLSSLTPLLDLVYFDLKLMDSQEHARYTGAPNARILNNFSLLAEEFPAVQARMPVIPGVNDSGENIFQTAAFLRHNNKDSIHLLPYHNLGQSKLTRLDAGAEPFYIRDIPEDYLIRAREAFEKEDVHAIVYE
ncbi:glycyl-radical enzyme activating protein [Desulfatibacillum aliphaticivorans]|uniref:glycyl-radical enzyme activating protein n=1 Tax=Desulfatibacillum aliphaticivorans TaxID=218208 RepID=UPI000424E4FC|nr:glycyl-radical enzyme activating protein [Desulfatibacillum aliphaticivorans]